MAGGSVRVHRNGHVDHSIDQTVEIHVIRHRRQLWVCHQHGGAKGDCIGVKEQCRTVDVRVSTCALRRLYGLANGGPEVFLSGSQCLIGMTPDVRVRNGLKQTGVLQSPAEKPSSHGV